MTRQTDTEHIRTSEGVRGDVLISLTHARSNVDDNYVRLEVTDQVSGLPLVHANLTAKQFTDIMSGTGTYVSGVRLPEHPERIGRRRQNVSTSLPRDVDRTPEEVRDAYLADGWERVRIDRTNYGHRVIAYRWIEDEATGADMDNARAVAEGK